MTSSGLLRKVISQNFFMVNKALLSKLGPCPAMLLSLLVDKDAYWDSTTSNFDGWFFKLAEEIEAELGLSDHDRRSCTRKLEMMGLIYTKRIGVPCKLHYKINHDAIDALIRSLDRGLIRTPDDEEEKTNNIRRDLNIEGLDLENLDLKRSKISTSITKNPRTENPPPEGSLRGVSSRTQEEVSRPSVDQIRRSWERSVISGNALPAQGDRLPFLRDLMATLRKHGYSEHDLPRNMAENVTAHWWSKAKDKKVKESLKERSLKEYDLALADLSEDVELASAPALQNSMQNRPKVANNKNAMSLDAFMDKIVDSGVLDESDAFYERMSELFEKDDLSEIFEKGD